MEKMFQFNVFRASRLIDLVPSLLYSAEDVILDLGGAVCLCRIRLIISDYKDNLLGSL